MFINIHKYDFVCEKTVSQFEWKDNDNEWELQQWKLRLHKMMVFAPTVLNVKSLQPPLSPYTPNEALNRTLYRYLPLPPTTNTH